MNYQWKAFLRSGSAQDYLAAKKLERIRRIGRKKDESNGGKGSWSGSS